MTDHPTLLLTGGAGFIGTRFLELYHREYGNIFVLDIQPEESCSVHSDNIKYIKGDILDIYELKDLPSNIDICIHMAALMNSRDEKMDSEDFFRVNEKGSEQVFNWCHDHGCKHMIVLSTVSIYSSLKGDTQKITEDKAEGPGGLTAYSQAEWAMEECARKLYPELNSENDMQINFIRLPYVYGPHQSPKEHPGFIMKAFKDAIDKGNISIFGDGEQVRDFIYVDDVCLAIKLLSLIRFKESSVGKNSDITYTDYYIKSLTLRRYPEHLEAFNCSSGVGYKITEVAQKAVEVLKTFCPARTIRLNWAPGSKKDAYKCVCDNSKLHEVLGWSPNVSLDKGLLETAKWFVEYYSKKEDTEKQGAGIM